MRARMTCGLALLALSVNFGASAQMRGPAPSGERREWNERYGRLADVFLRKEYKSFRQMAAPDCAWNLTGGRTLNAAQMEKELARKLDAVKPNTQFTMNITKLGVSGSTAVVERTQVIAGFYSDAAGGRHRAFDGSGWEDHWVKTAKGWQLKSAKQFNETLTVDGRPGNPYARTAPAKPAKPNKAPKAGARSPQNGRA